MNLVLASQQWIAVAEALVATCVVLALVAAIQHFRRSRAGGGGTPWTARGATAALWAAALVMFAAVWQRGVEVNHFPSQTMSEVLTMFSFALLVAMVALHYALGLRRRGPGWAILDDALVALVGSGVLASLYYTSGLSTAQRDLPPALQSYWFAPHLSSLIFSYATLVIAGAICVVYFCIRFWSGALGGGQKRSRQVWTLLGLTLVPFAQIVTIPVLVVSGLVFLVLKARGRVPDAAAVLALEKDLDDVSFRAFSVGMPFLTAGLFMGAFWAQEAWANYWGWDSKENSALISWLVYVLYIHLRMLGGYRGEKAMAILIAGAFSIFTTFQLFGYLPDSQKSLHRYTDDNIVPREGMQGPSASQEPQSSAAPAVEPESMASKGR